MRIKDIPLQNRPRQRFVKKGASALSDSELLAVILQKGTKAENAVEMCNRLLSKYSIQKLSGLSLTELQEVKGIGPAKAMQIKALFEFLKRAKTQDKTYINSADDVFGRYYPKLKDEKQEKFIVLLLDTKSRVIAEEVVSIGILDSALIHPREVFKPAIRNSASKIILVHNHPSGDPKPSQEDLVITDKIIEAGKLLGISVLDHVIIGERYWSWRNNR
ncbi:DNA repair protein RadC [Candidatus Woesearchaeota archaeon]|nr:DNA repair protein RadC [Candidatus Woesearchaeota archaeon]